MRNERAYVPFSCVFNDNKMSHTVYELTSNDLPYRYVYLVCVVKDNGERLHVLNGFFINTNINRNDERYLSMLVQGYSHLEGVDSALLDRVSFLSLKIKIEGAQYINEEEGRCLMKYQYQALVNKGMTSFKGSVHRFV
ncbi:hypothetical protein [Aliivibrio sp. SR45-2]|uniref:hypothetical protein n=1 Tax=Aliivibrio sp. SR45-2 TaxID=2760931 RepID=UPI0015FC218E|nr:hypothetical protein [Aliivibrio sp. SR45-2]MBB1313470.1 hypothetical protein [Aliivibrio sp. SR45-2]